MTAIWPHIERRCGRDRRHAAELLPASDRRSGHERRRPAPLGATAAEDGSRPPWQALVDASLPDDLCVAAQPGRPLFGAVDMPADDGQQAATAAVAGCPAGRVLSRQLDRLAGRLLQTTERIYATAMDPEGWPLALADLASLLGADGAALMMFDERPGLHYIRHTFGLDHFGAISLRTPPEILCALTATMSEFRTPGVVFTTAALERADARLFAVLRKEWIERGGWDDVLFGVIDRRDGFAHYLLFFAGGGRRPFNAGEMSMLARLLPDVRQSLRIEAVIQVAAPMRAAMAAALDRSPLGIIILDRDATCLYANRRGAEVMAPAEPGRAAVGNRARGITLDGCPLHVATLFAAASRLPEDGEAAEAWQVPRGEDRRPLSLLAIALDHEPCAVNARRPATMFIVGDPERVVDVDQAMLRRLYALTRAEARVAALVCRGQRVEDIARMLDLSFDTVRKHLRQVFLKTRTDRQAALVNLLLTSPAAAPPPTAVAATATKQGRLRR